jgi:hypothetical protein
MSAGQNGHPVGMQIARPPARLAAQ